MKEYIAKKVNSEMKIDDERWAGAPKAALDYVWENNSPSPYKTMAQAVHSEEGITVRLTTNEWPLTITTMELNGKICIDSCMEFFFIPNMDDNEYINLEMNPAAVLPVRWALCWRQQAVLLVWAISGDSLIWRLKMVAAFFCCAT